MLNENDDEFLFTKTKAYEIKLHPQKKVGDVASTTDPAFAFLTREPDAVQTVFRGVLSNPITKHC